VHKKTKLSVIVPVYNEEKNIKPLVSRLLKLFAKMRIKYEIVFVMDPCTDLTEKGILEIRSKDDNVKLLKMSRRFGQPACTLAGLQYCSGSVGVVIDADLQDPPELIGKFIEKWEQGYEIVYGQRIDRKGETIIKKIVSYLGYWLINKISEVSIPRNTGDFRLLDREVIDHVVAMKDHDGFLRGLVGFVGFSQIAIKYNRESRLTGKGKYNMFLGSLRIGVNGVIGFSIYPLHIISIFGITISSLSFMLGIIYLFLKIINYPILWGNPTLVILISFLSGIQLLSLGIMGEYLGRMYEEVKNRPIFIIDKKYGFDEKKRTD